MHLPDDSSLETNIDIKIERLFGIYSDPQYGAVRRYSTDLHPKQIVDIYLLASPSSFEIKKSDESLDVKFFDLNDLPPDKVPYCVEVIDDYKRDAYNTCTVLK